MRLGAPEGEKEGGFGAERLVLEKKEEWGRWRRRKLNRRGIPTRRHRSWCPTTHKGMPPSTCTIKGATHVGALYGVQIQKYILWGFICEKSFGKGLKWKIAQLYRSWGCDRPTRTLRPDPLLAVIKCQFHTPTCRAYARNDHVNTLSTNQVPRF
jgi:hypothetical protein